MRGGKNILCQHHRSPEMGVSLRLSGFKSVMETAGALVSLMKPWKPYVFHVMQQMLMRLWVVVWKMFYFHPNFRKSWSNLTSIFFRWVGKNHQLGDCVRCLVANQILLQFWVWTFFGFSNSGSLAKEWSFNPGFLDLFLTPNFYRQILKGIRIPRETSSLKVRFSHGSFDSCNRFNDIIGVIVRN